MLNLLHSLHYSIQHASRLAKVDMKQTSNCKECCHEPTLEKDSKTTPTENCESTKPKEEAEEVKKTADLK